MNTIKNILLVDDDDIFNMLHSEVIKRLNPTTQIHVFKSGVEVIDFIQLHPDQPIDLIFLDIRMPVMGGFEALDIMATMVADRFKNTRIYVLSSTLDDRDLQRAKATPLVTDFIGKPMSFDTMRGILGQSS
jgi:CheY-like chemotaxis protein